MASTNQPWVVPAPTLQYRGPIPDIEAFMHARYSRRRHYQAGVSLDEQVEGTVAMVREYALRMYNAILQTDNVSDELTPKTQKPAQGVTDIRSGRYEDDDIWLAAWKLVYDCFDLQVGANYGSHVHIPRTATQADPSTSIRTPTIEVKPYESFDARFAEAHKLYWLSKATCKQMLDHGLFDTSLMTMAAPETIIPKKTKGNRNNSRRPTAQESRKRKRDGFSEDTDVASGNDVDGARASLEDFQNSSSGYGNFQGVIFAASSASSNGRHPNTNNNFAMDTNSFGNREGGIGDRIDNNSEAMYLERPQQNSQAHLRSDLYATHNPLRKKVNRMRQTTGPLQNTWADDSASFPASPIGEQNHFAIVDSAHAGLEDDGSAYSHVPSGSQRAGYFHDNVENNNSLSTGMATSSSHPNLRGQSRVVSDGQSGEFDGGNGLMSENVNTSQPEQPTLPTRRLSAEGSVKPTPDDHLPSIARRTLAREAFNDGWDDYTPEMFGMVVDYRSRVAAGYDGSDFSVGPYKTHLADGSVVERNGNWAWAVIPFQNEFAAVMSATHPLPPSSSTAVPQQNQSHEASTLNTTVEEEHPEAAQADRVDEENLFSTGAFSHYSS